MLNLVHSYVSLNVPLYVSYISHSPTRIPWRHFDLESDLRLTFVYDTAKMWTDGIGTPPEAELPGLTNKKSQISSSELYSDFLFRNVLPNIDENSSRRSPCCSIQNGCQICWNVCFESSRKVKIVFFTQFLLIFLFSSCFSSHFFSEEDPEVGYTYVINR